MGRQNSTMSWRFVASIMAWHGCDVAQTNTNTQKPIASERATETWTPVYKGFCGHTGVIGHLSYRSKGKYIKPFSFHYLPLKSFHHWWYGWSKFSFRICPSSKSQKGCRYCQKSSHTARLIISLSLKVTWSSYGFITLSYHVTSVQVLNCIKIMYSNCSYKHRN